VREQDSPRRVLATLPTDVPALTDQRCPGRLKVAPSLNKLQLMLCAFASWNRKTILEDKELKQLS